VSIAVLVQSARHSIIQERTRKQSEAAHLRQGNVVR